MKTITAVATPPSPMKTFKIVKNGRDDYIAFNPLHIVWAPSSETFFNLVFLAPAKGKLHVESSETNLLLPDRRSQRQ